MSEPACCSMETSSVGRAPVGLQAISHSSWMRDDVAKGATYDT